eukprot:11224807-Ditylum_brightwellii.AAC.1
MQDLPSHCDGYRKKFGICHALDCKTALKPTHLLQFTMNPISNQVRIAAVRLRVRRTTHLYRCTRSQRARRGDYVEI